VLDWYRALVALRGTEPELASGDLRTVAVDHDEDGRWLVVRRGALRVAVNLAGEAQQVPLDVSPTEVVLAWDGADVDGSGVVLAAGSVAVLRG